MKLNLIQWGVDNIGYDTLKNSKRYFAKAFNQFYGLVEENEVGTIEEIIVFALNLSALKKANKITEWLDSYKEEKGLVVVNEDETVTDQVAVKIEEIKQRQSDELLNIVAKEVFGLKTVGIDESIPRGTEITDLSLVDSKDITKKKEVKEKVTKEALKPKTEKSKKVVAEKADMLANFEASMKKDK